MVVFIGVRTATRPPESEAQLRKLGASSSMFQSRSQIQMVRSQDLLFRESLEAGFWT